MNFLMVTTCVFCEMGTGCLNVYMNDFYFKSFILSTLIRKISFETKKSYFVPVTLELHISVSLCAIKILILLFSFEKKLCKL
jgi:hypothetical protein